MVRILLCIDSECARHPEISGFPTDSFEDHPWLSVATNAAEARTTVAREQGLEEAWVVSVDDMGALNVVAAPHSDREDLAVLVVDESATGSLRSRAAAAGATAVVSAHRIAERFVAAKRVESMIDDAAELGSDELEESPELSFKPVEARTQVTANMGSPASNQGSRFGSAYVLTVLGGSGGVGKSSVCAVSAALCSQANLRTAVVDCDMQFGDIRDAFGRIPSISMDEAIGNPERFESMASKQGEYPMLVSAPSRPELAEELMDQAMGLVAACSRIFDVVIVNTGCYWSELHAQLLEKSSTALFLVDQRASSVRGCTKALDLCMRIGIASGTFAFALNRCSKGSMFDSIDISNVLDGVSVQELADGGREVEEMLGAGKALDLTTSDNAFAVSLAAMLSQMLPDVAGRASVSKEKSLESPAPRTTRRKPRRRTKQREMSEVQEPFGRAVQWNPNDVPASEVVQ